MNKNLRARLIAVAVPHMKKNDISHDMRHAMRVLANAEFIGRKEQANLDVLVPAALFHDLIVSPKNNPSAAADTERSAALAAKILNRMKYNTEKIKAICYAISICSYSKNISPKTLEAAILQDADKLESTGAISIMRTFGSAGSTGFVLYDETDPLAESRDVRLGIGLDLFFMRLLKVKERMHTRTARRIAIRRTKIIHQFLREFKKELSEVK